MLILKPPFFISSRLLVGLKVADATISYDVPTSIFYIDTPEFEHAVLDFRPGIGGPVEAFRAILSFLSAAGESYRWSENQGTDPYDDPDSNVHLFPRQVTSWAADNRDEISCTESDLEDADDAISKG